RPSSSAAASISRAVLSLMEPAGLRASNFGAPHTLVEQSTFFTYFEYSEEELVSIGVPRGTVRLALGYSNDVTAIIKDLDQALSHVQGQA
ncbi:hypothetical protein ACM614_14305, partial [Streptomyces sp. 12297]